MSKSEAQFSIFYHVDITAIKGFRPLVQLQSCKKPLVGCPRLPIQHICSYLSYMDVVPSVRDLPARYAQLTRIHSHGQKLHA